MSIKEKLSQAIDIADTTPKSVVGFFANWEEVKSEINSYKYLNGHIDFCTREYVTNFGGVVKFIQTASVERIAGLNFSHVFIEIPLTASEYSYIQSRLRWLVGG